MNWPSSAWSGYSERAFEFAQQDRMVYGVKSSGKIEGNENGSKSKIYCLINNFQERISVESSFLFADWRG